MRGTPSAIVHTYLHNHTKTIFLCYIRTYIHFFHTKPCMYVLIPNNTGEATLPSLFCTCICMYVCIYLKATQNHACMYWFECAHACMYVFISKLALNTSVNAWARLAEIEASNFWYGTGNASKWFPGSRLKLFFGLWMEMFQHKLCCIFVMSVRQLTWMKCMCCEMTRLACMHVCM